MHFITIASLLAAVVTVSAMPGSPVQERQSTPTIYARFYPDGGCHGDWVDDTVFVQGSTASDCVNNSVTNGYLSTEFTGNTATRTLKVYSLPNCNESGNSFLVAPGQNGCFAQKIGSSKFI